MADVVWFQPSDSLRFGCRVGSERQSGLVPKLQALRVNGTVLGLLAFSEVDLQSTVPLAIGHWRLCFGICRQLTATRWQTFLCTKPLQPGMAGYCAVQYQACARCTVMPVDTLQQFAEGLERLQ